MKTRFLTLLAVLFSLSVFSQHRPQADSLDAQEVFTVVEKLPAFPGGDAKLFEYLRGCFRFPKKGRVSRFYLSFFYY